MKKKNKKSRLLSLTVDRLLLTPQEAFSTFLHEVLSNCMPVDQYPQCYDDFEGTHEYIISVCTWQILGHSLPEITGSC